MPNRIKHDARWHKKKKLFYLWAVSSTSVDSNVRKQKEKGTQSKWRGGCQWWWRRKKKKDFLHSKSFTHKQVNDIQSSWLLRLERVSFDRLYSLSPSSSCVRTFTFHCIGRAGVEGKRKKHTHFHTREWLFCRFCVRVGFFREIPTFFFSHFIDVVVVAGDGALSSVDHWR